MYLKTYFHSHGNQIVEPILLPTTNFILESDHYWETLRNRFVQAQRHMWSFYEMAYLLQNSSTSPMTWWKNFFRTLNLHVKVFYLHFLAVIPLPALLLSNILFFYYYYVEGDPVIESISYPTRIISIVAFTLSALSVLANHYVIRNVLKGKENQYGYKSYIIYGVIEYVLLNALAGFIFAFLPSMSSLTKLMITDKLDYVVAQKPVTKEVEEV